MGTSVSFSAPTASQDVRESHMHDYKATVAMSRGDLFGETALLTGYVVNKSSERGRTGSVLRLAAKARTFCKLLRIEKQAFADAVSNYPREGEKVIANYLQVRGGARTFQGGLKGK